jgi:hypothetical protein
MPKYANTITFLYAWLTPMIATWKGSELPSHEHKILEEFRGLV